jgi:hypothetical protein
LHIRCVSSAAPLEAVVIREIAGAVPADDPGLRPAVVCPAGFSADAVRFAAHHGVQLFDGDRLAELLVRTPAVQVDRPAE